MAKESIFGVIEVIMRENGNKIYKMEKVFL
jgi:hypothetical protein